jgi:hypothetical protein
VSLFGKLFKAGGKLLGGLARTGLSVATHGASDKVLSLLKKSGGGKAAGTPQREQLTTQQQALLNKVAEPLAPKVKQTTLYQAAQAGNAQYGSYGPKRSAYTRRSAARSAQEPRQATKSPRKASGTGRTISPAMRARANQMRALAAQWRGLGGKEGTGLSFFAWKKGR